MNPRDVLERLKGEVGQWRTRLDELRLQAGLGKLELRDRREEVMKNFDRSYRDARKRLDEVSGGAQGELETLRKSVDAGWKELRKTYDELREERGQR